MTTYAEFREDLHPKDVVLGVGDGDDALGFPRSRLVAAGGVGAATVGERAVVAFATPDGVHGYEHPGVGPGVGGRVRAGQGRTVPRRRDRLGRDDRSGRGRSPARAGPGPPAVRVRVAGRPRPGRVLVGGVVFRYR
jgi:hypothetical protein